MFEPVYTATCAPRFRQSLFVSVLVGDETYSVSSWPAGWLGLEGAQLMCTGYIGIAEIYWI